MHADEKLEHLSSALQSIGEQSAMTSKKQAFLNHLALCRRKVEQWPEWKQAFLKPPARARTSDSEAKEQDNLSG
ncbi:hypothetical protein [Pseudomonas sp. CFBP 13602]|uniref:hypothetical protein n=1 Tax=Pseudomonas sp. CFBP 13602 TaxID=2774039 RepID=UPI00178081B1|nr:hypothetical protein [Pseudomonas sp. CFBP 13602]MBD8826722.1 hypothetical protein [Pseudomonas sp. CFBP 13602]